MEIQLLNDIVIIFGLSVIVIFICHRFRVPVIVGFFLTGILAGPRGLGLIQAVHEVEILAEVGVVLLLFAIGMEFSFKRLLQIKKSVLLGGSLQVLFTVLAIFLIARQFGQSFGEAVFMGFLVSLSSTAIVLNIIQARAEIDSPQGRTALAILIFQDVIIIPMMLFTPFLARTTGNASESLLILSAKGIVIILLVIVSAKWIVPKVLYQITRTQSRELFLLSILAICLAVVWLTASAGLSLALGAFLAGLIISESEYSHQALGNILPFRDVFMSFFFVSVGMLLDAGFLIRQPVLIVLIASGVLLLKAVIAGVVTMLLGFPLRTGILVGLILSQVGEFSFILSKTGIEHGLLAGENYQMFLSASVLTMAAAPFIIALAPRIADFVGKLSLPERLKSAESPARATHKDSTFSSLKDHLIVIGFGTNGRNMARAARAANIAYVIIEMNPDTVRSERAKGEPIFYGDATNAPVLHHANIKEARILVVAISDPAAIGGITRTARRLNPALYIIVRTRFLQEMKPLYQLGADEVVPEEFETSVEIFTLVLMKYLVPKDEIERFIAEIRSENYQMFRSLSPRKAQVSDLKPYLSNVEINSVRVDERSPLVEKTLDEMDLRKKYGVTVLAIRRGTKVVPNPGKDTKIYAQDLLIVLGSLDRINQVKDLSQR
jgi:CPA2 family monovalent cation:H+ antiporter-2